MKNVLGLVVCNKNPLVVVPMKIPKLAKLVKIAYSVAATFLTVTSMKRAHITEVIPPTKTPYKI